MNRLLFIPLLVLFTSSVAQTIGNWPMEFIDWEIKDCPQFPQYDYWERNCLIKTAEPYDEIRLPQGGVDGLNLEQPMWISIPTNRPTWAIAIAHAWNLHRNFIQQVDYPKIGYYMAITGHETGMACDCDADFTSGHRPWSTTGQGELNWPAKCGQGARSDDGCFQMEFYNAWGELNQIFPHRFPCSKYEDVISGDVFETQALALSYRNIGYSLLMEYSWNMNPWEIFDNPACDKYAYEKFLAASWNGSIAGTYKTLTQSNVFSLGGWEPDPTKQKANPVHMFENRAATATNPNWDLDGTVAYYPEVIAWCISAIEGDSTYPGYRYDPADYTGALISTGTGQAGELDYLGQPIPAGQKINLNSVNGTYAELQDHVQFGYYNEDIYWTDVDYYIDRMLPFYFEFDDPAIIDPVKDRVKEVYVAMAGSEFNPIPFKQLGPIIDEIILAFPKENPLVAMLQLDGIPNGPSGSGHSTCTGIYAPASHIKPVNIETDTMCTDQTLILAADVVGGEEPDMSYTWYLDGNVVADGVNIKEYAFTPTVIGVYQFNLMVCNHAGGCSMAACTYEIEVKECNSCNLAAVITPVNTPCRNTEAGSLQFAITGSSNYTVSYDGPNVGSVSGSSSNLTIDELKDGHYNIRIQDNDDPNCFYITSEEVDYDFYMNDVVEASVVEQRDCETEITADIVKDDCKCDYTVFGRALIANRWERYITMKITPSNGQFEIFRGDVFTNSGEPLSRKFQLCTGESIKGELHMIPASGSCDPARVDAVNNQLESYEVWVVDPEGTEVFRQTFGPGTALQFDDYLMFDIDIECPYTSPFDYTYAWDPSGKTDQTITETYGNNGDILYTVTATNIQHPQCFVKDSILVPFSCSTGCNDPGVVSLSPSGNVGLCGGSQLLTASATNPAPVGGYNYEFFLDGTSVQGPGSTNSYSATAAGDYYVVITDPSNPGVCTSQSEFTTLTIDTPPSIADAGVGGTVCGNEFTLSGTSPAVGTGRWSVSSGQATIADDTDPLSLVTALGSGDNILRWTVSNGACPQETSEITITALDPPSVAVAGDDEVLCGEGSTLSAVPPVQGVGAWSVLSGSGTFGDATSASSTVSGLGVGTNEFVWTVSVAGCASNTDTVMITRDGEPTTSNAGLDETLCINSHALGANAITVGSGLWTVVSGSGTFDDASSESTQVTGLSTGDNILRWTVSNGVCPQETSEITIIVLDPPSVAVAGDDEVLCGEGSTMSAVPPVQGEGLWSVLSGTGTFGDATSATSSVSGLGVGTNEFVWTVSVAGCSSTRDTVMITRDAKPTIASAGSDETICSTSQDLTGNVLLVGTGAWTLLSGSGSFADPSLATTNVSGLGVGDNLFRWTSSNGSCPVSESDVTITVLDGATNVDAGADQVICSTGGVLAAQVPNAGTGSWTLTSGAGLVDDPTSPTSTVSDLGVGVNVFEWSVANGSCPAQADQVQVTRDEDPSVANAGADQNICADQVTLSADAISVGTGTWTVQSGSGVFSDENSHLSAVTGLAVGDNVFRWTSSSGVCPTTESQVTISVLATLTTPVAGDDQTICADNATFLANTPMDGVGTWSLVSGSGVLSSDSPTASVTGLGIGANTFRWTISNGVCPDLIDDVVISRDEEVSMADAGTDQFLCSDNTTLIAVAPSVGIGEWSLTSGVASIGDVNNPNTSITNLVDGSATLRWTISNGVCPVSDAEVVLTKSSSAVADAIISPLSPAPVCEGHDFTFTVTPVNGGVAPSFEWYVNGASQGLGSATSQEFLNPQQGDSIYVVMTSDLACATGSPARSQAVYVAIDQNPSLAEAGTDADICSDSQILGATALAVGQGTWSVANGSGNFDDIHSPTATVTSLSLGENTLLWTSSNGVCPETQDQVIVNVRDNSIAADAGSHQTFCETTASTSVEGNLPSGWTGQWNSTSAGVTILSPDETVTTVSGLTQGSHSFTWTLTDGVCPDVSDEVLITLEASPSNSVAGDDQSICVAVSSLSANTPITGSGKWSVISGTATMVNDTDPETEVTLIDDEAVFEWEITSANTCGVSRDQVKVTSLGTVPTDVSLSANANPICAGDQVQFTADITNGGAAPTISWTLNGIALGSSINPVTIDLLENGDQVEVEVTSSLPCAVPSFASDEVIMAVVAPPSPAIAEGDLNFCENDTRVLNAIGTGDFVWYQNGNLMGAGTSIDLGANASGTWVLEEFNSVCGTVATDPITVSVDAMPDVDAGDDVKVLFGESVDLDATVDQGNIEWIDPVFSSSAFVEDPTVTPQDPMQDEIIYTLQSTNGTCIASDEVTVIVDFPINIPNVFTPNGDGINDQWNVTGLDEIEGVMVTVFNRWGNEVYRTYANDVHWDGHKGNKEMPTGTYYYVVQEGQDSYEGFVELMR